MLELKQTETFRQWRTRIKDERVRGIIASRLDRLAFGHAGDVRPVGERISELRIDRGPRTASTFKGAASRSSCCSAAATRAPKLKTSETPNC
jgi:putative addiction module killer protein